MADLKMKQAVDLYKSGDKKKAMKLLAEIVRSEPENTSAWYELALCVEDPERKEYCLKKVLKINPNHQEARQLLISMIMNSEGLDNINNPSVESEYLSKARKGTLEQNYFPVSNSFSSPHPPELIAKTTEIKSLEELIRCQYCGKKIPQNSRYCRYCGRNLYTTIRKPKKRSVKQTLSAGDVVIAFIMPILGLILAVFYIMKSQSRERGFSLVVVSLIAWAVWWVICSFTGAL
jgi:hypothetical protein